MTSDIWVFGLACFSLGFSVATFLFTFKVG